MASASLSLARLARASAVHVCVAFLAMGGWTLFANRTHGSAAIVPAMVQGAVSGLITLVLKRVLEAFSRRLSGPLAYVLPPLATASVILGLLIGVHRLIRTPEILATIAVPWSVSTGYAILYTAALRRNPHGRAR
jgi:hypothetical protein